MIFRQSIRFTMASALLAFASATFANPQASFNRPAHVPAPPDNAITPARVALGKALFFDPRLSGSGWVSCASCHNPGLGWSDGLPTAMGDGMKKLSRATPTIINVAYNKLQMWDGRFATLEDQALGPISSADEMNQDIPGLLVKLKAINGYLEMFDKAYPGEGVSPATVSKALASFQRTVVAQEAPFDRWRSGSTAAIDSSAKRGFELFTGKANCVACHQGHSFSDDGFHNIGLKSLREEADLGRFSVRKVNAMRGAFKTPTLRDIALTAPYMHNGLYATLEEVVEHYDRGGDVTTNVSPEIKPLNLTTQEKQDLVAFMKTLTGKPVQVTLPNLPR